MRYGFVIPGGDARAVAELAREAETAGWDGVFVPDCISIETEHIPASPGFDPWIVLAAMALRNDRVVLPRDCADSPGAKAFPDTADPANPEGGWLRFAVLRIFETNEGYTSTAGEFVRACGALQGHAIVGGTSTQQMGAPVALSSPADARSPGSRRGASP